MNHRQTPRLRRRLKVTLGPIQTFTADISAGGFAAEVMQSLPPGSMQHGSIELCGQRFDFPGLGCWAPRGEPRMNKRGRFGLRFTGISNAFFELLRSAYGPNPTHA